MNDMKSQRGKQLTLLRQLRLPSALRTKHGQVVATGIVKAVLRAIDDYDGGKGAGCWASASTIAADIDFSESAVNRSIEILKTLGAITITPRHGMTSILYMNWLGIKLLTFAHGAEVDQVKDEGTFAPGAEPPLPMGQIPLPPGQTTFAHGADKTELKRPLNEKRNENSVSVVSFHSSKPKAKTKAKGKYDPMKETIPDSLNTPAFKEKWSQWCAHRSEIGKPMTQTATKSQIATLESWGVSKAIRSIDTSIQAGWPGLYPVKLSPEEAEKKKDELARQADERRTAEQLKAKEGPRRAPPTPRWKQDESSKPYVECDAVRRGRELEEEMIREDAEYAARKANVAKPPQECEALRRAREIKESVEREDAEWEAEKRLKAASTNSEVSQ